MLLSHLVGSSTGIGSMPGDNSRAVTEIICGELATVHLAELPHRGPGSDLVGRAAGILTDLPFDVIAGDYRLVQGKSTLARRAKSLLSEDCDLLEEVWERSGRSSSQKSSTNVVKTQVVGPYTLAASLELRTGVRAIKDSGAINALIDSLADGIATQAKDLARRLNAQLIVQLDEPLLADVIDGYLKPPTRLDVINPITAQQVSEGYARFIAAVGYPVILRSVRRRHPWEIFGQFDGVCIDLGSITRKDYDALGALSENDCALFLGVIPVQQPIAHCAIEEVLQGVVQVTDKIGISRKTVARQAIITPQSGFAATNDVEWIKQALALAQRASETLTAQAADI